MKRNHIKIVLIILTSILLVNYYFFKGIKLTETIPVVFKDKKIAAKFINGMTYVYENGEIAYPVTHDNEALYILNGAGKDFTKYKIEKEANEVIIWQNLCSAVTRSKNYYQVVTVPKQNYESLIQKGKIKIRINYLYLGGQYTLIEYDTVNKTSKVIDQRIIGK